VEPTREALERDVATARRAVATWAEILEMPPVRADDEATDIVIRAQANAQARLDALEARLRALDPPPLDSGPAKVP
jgi:hypothetical protein